jgi:DNA (cytosine-5)-methyltransferase 1
VRRLTPLECERLQNLPDEWTRWKLAGGELAELSDSARYRVIGNAVTVSVVRWIAARIVAAEDRRGAVA